MVLQVLNRQGRGTKDKLATWIHGLRMEQQREGPKCSS